MPLKRTTIEQGLEPAGSAETGDTAQSTATLVTTTTVRSIITHGALSASSIHNQFYIGHVLQSSPSSIFSALNTYIMSLPALTATVPAAPPPPGVVSDFVDPPYIGTSFVIINTVFMILAILAVTVRIYTRVVIVRGFGVDDCGFGRSSKHEFCLEASI